MQLTRSALVAVLVLGIAGSGMALAQTSTTPPASSTPAASSDDTSSWSKKKWSEVKAKWAKEKVKYADCRKQAKEEKLTGTKSLSFTYDCMNK
jgi:hypothetical protein